MLQYVASLCRWDLWVPRALSSLGFVGAFFDSLITNLGHLALGEASSEASSCTCDRGLLASLEKIIVSDFEHYRSTRLHIILEERETYTNSQLYILHSFNSFCFFYEMKEEIGPTRLAISV